MYYLRLKGGIQIVGYGENEDLPPKIFDQYTFLRATHFRVEPRVDIGIAKNEE